MAAWAGFEKDPRGPLSITYICKELNCYECHGLHFFLKDVLKRDIRRSHSILMKGRSMKIGSFCFLVPVIFSLFFQASLVTGSETPLPFIYGEKLSFKVKWVFIPAGEAVLEVMSPEKLDGRTVNHFRMTARTYDYIDPIYKVRDQVDSITDIGMNHALQYLIQAKGKEKKDVVVNFDWGKKQATFSDFGNKQPPISILPASFDPLSVFYAFRLFVLKEGAELKLAVSDGKKSIMGRAKVIKLEKVKVPAGTFKTYLVEPELEHIGGVFRKSKDAKLQIWVTADKSHIPVRIKSKVVVGSFIAELVDAQNINLNIP
jgi:hypothetical protein